MQGFFQECHVRVSDMYPKQFVVDTSRIGQLTYKCNTSNLKQYRYIHTFTLNLFQVCVLRP